MEPTLDEASLIPCEVTPPGERVKKLAATLKRLDAIGAPRVLRSVRDAPHRDLGLGRGLSHWCFDGKTNRDAGRFVALRLDKAPYIDGDDGLFARSEGGRAIAPSIGTTPSFGGGQVALSDGLLVLLPSASWPPEKPVRVKLEVLTEDDEWVDVVTILAVDSEEEVDRERAGIEHRITSSVANGSALLERLTELCPRVDLGPRAIEQLAKMDGSEPFFPQVLRHLRALDRAAHTWRTGTPFAPEGVTSSPESAPTLAHHRYGPMRDFPTPPDFDPERWTYHTKLTGGEGARLYFKGQEVPRVGTDGQTKAECRVAVGYVGPHLPTVRYPT